MAKVIIHLYEHKFKAFHEAGQIKYRTPGAQASLVASITNQPGILPAAVEAGN